MDTQQDTGMRDVWCWALSWLRKPPSHADKRAKQTELVEAILLRIRHADSPAALHHTYEQDSRWVLALAKSTFPREWSTLGIHACTAAAYGIRYAELMTGREVDAKNLPSWLGEWAIW